VTQKRTIVDVDARGRVSLARFGLKDTQLIVDPLPDGGLVLHQAIALTPAEAAHYQDTEAISELKRGLADAQSGRVKSLTLRSEPTAAAKRSQSP